MYKKIISFILLICFVFNINTVAFGADPIYVYVNNNILTYSDIQPQIVNQRAMVPIRRTAEALGATIDWNSQTEVMTITKGNYISVHTMRTNIVTTNGTAKTFDTPSTNSNGRIMMPIRMLAETLGCEVTWDNSSRSVKITMESASIKSAIIDKTTAYAGDSVTITIKGNDKTEQVKVVDTSNNAVITTSGAYTTDSNGERAFSIPWIIPNDTSTSTSSKIKTLKVYPGTASGIIEAETSSKNCSININSDFNPRIISVVPDYKTVTLNSYVTLNITTNQSTNFVKVDNDFKAAVIESTNYDSSGNQRVFSVRVKLPELGTRKLVVYAGSSSYVSPYETVSINVENLDSSTSNKDRVLTIYSTELQNSDVYTGQSAYITVKTTSDISGIEVRNNKGNRITNTYNPDNKNASSNVYTWNLSFDIDTQGKNEFTVVAYNSNNKEVTENISVYGQTYSSNDTLVLSVTPKTSSFAIGDTIKFNVKTTTKVAKVIVKDYNGNEVATSTSPSSDSGLYRFDIEFKITSASQPIYTFTGYSSSGDSNTKRYTLPIKSTANAEITSISVEKTTVNKGDIVKVKVYTNSAVNRVWISDNDGVRVSKYVEKYEIQGNDRYYWELEFDAETKGSRVGYYVNAENTDSAIKDVDDYKFNMKIE